MLEYHLSYDIREDFSQKVISQVRFKRWIVANLLCKKAVNITSPVASTLVFSMTPNYKVHELFHNMRECMNYYLSVVMPDECKKNDNHFNKFDLCFSSFSESDNDDKNINDKFLDTILNPLMKLKPELLEEELAPPIKSS